MIFDFLCCCLLGLSSGSFIRTLGVPVNKLRSTLVTKQTRISHHKGRKCLLQKREKTNESLAAPKQTGKYGFPKGRIFGPVLNQINKKISFINLFQALP